jgi:hypothetical protein
MGNLVFSGLLCAPFLKNPLNGYYYPTTITPPKKKRACAAYGAEFRGELAKARHRA